MDNLSSLILLKHFFYPHAHVNTFIFSPISKQVFIQSKILCKMFSNNEKLSQLLEETMSSKLTDGGVESKEGKWDFGIIRECLGNNNKVQHSKISSTY